MLVVSMSFLVTLVGGGSIGFYNKHYFDVDDKYRIDELAKAIACSFVFLLLLVPVLWVLLLFHEFSKNFYFVLPLSYLLYVFRLLLLHTQLSEEPAKYFLFFCLYGVLSSALLVFFILLDMDIVFSFLFSYGMSLSVVLSFYFYYIIGFKGSITIVSYILSLSKVKYSFFIVFSFSWPLYLDSVFAMGFSVLDKYLISKYLSLEDVGYYYLAFQCSMILLFFFDSFLKVLMPVIMRELSYVFKVKQVVKYRVLYTSLVFSFMLVVYFSVSIIFGFFFKDLVVGENTKKFTTVFLNLLFFQFLMSQVRFDNIILLKFGFSKYIMITGLVSSIIFVLLFYTIPAESLSIIDVSLKLIYASFFWMTSIFSISTYVLFKRSDSKVLN